MYIVVLSWFPEDHCNRLLEMCRAVSYLQAGVKEPMEARKKYLQRLMEDSIRDIVRAGCLVWCGSVYCFLDLMQCDFRAFNRWGVVVSINIREISTNRWWEERLA